MPTATIAKPTASLVGDAYTELAADLRALAQRVLDSPALPPPAPVPAPTGPARTAPPATPRTVAGMFLRSLGAIAGHVLLFVVLLVLAFNVAFRLFPPPR